ncbi:peptidoglycan-binding protein [Shimia sp.]|uniref:peptidoglycan-binding protein n=1 Tax=Shimia sp. TaxID=1954381 RepID=UPI00356581BC
MLFSLPALAADLALVLTVEDYRYQPPLRADPNLRSIAQKLRRSGFEVIVNDRQDSAGLRAATARFSDRLRQGADRVMVVVSGHYASAFRSPWLLGADAGDVGALDIGGSALPLGGLTALVAGHQGQAVVVVGRYERDLILGQGAGGGLAGLSFPHGVSGFLAPADRLDSLVAELLTPGRPLAEIAKSAGPGIEARGYQPRAAAFLPYLAPVDPGEGSYWDALRDLGTEQALRFYLDRYPNGRHAGEARAALRQLRHDEAAQMKQAETQLGLSPSQRRAVQEDLTLLGYDTRGIDGVFGNGTRRAITGFQRDNALPATGFLTAQTHDVLRDKADRKRQLQDRRDRQLWREVEGRDSLEGYARYLDAYPDGLFAAEARRRHAELSRSQSQVGDQAAWEQALYHDGLTGYRAYLEAHPHGRYADEARRRVEAFERIQDNQDLLQRQSEQERSLAGNQISRLLVEQRLSTHGEDPGAIDGVFDENTRRALRRFQRSRGVPVTGLVSQKTMLLLVAG